MSILSPQLIKTNLLSGLTVALAMVPEAIAFALVAQVSPLTGLYAAFIVALITSAFGGRPGMISGAAGALAVVASARGEPVNAVWIVGAAATGGPEAEAKLKEATDAIARLVRS